MGQIVNIESVATALVVAIIFAFVKLFRDVDQIKTAQKYEVDALKLEIRPVVDWYVKTSMDALKIATNPISERLTELANKYKKHVVQGEPMSVAEKEELINGLKAILNDRGQYEAKRQSASMSLRFIETREGLTAKSAGAK